MPELRVAAVIFDMDGVVIDSGDVYQRHWQRWGAEHGIDYARIAPVHPGRPPVETIKLVAPGLDAAAEAKRFNAGLTESTDADAATAMPGAVELLSSLPSVSWTIATSAARDIATRWLAHVGVPVPATLVAVEDVARGKPAPDPYLVAATRLAVDPTRCLVIEDAPAGITGAKAAGATVLALRTTHEPGDLDEADHQTTSLADVRAEASAEGLVVSWRQPD